VQPLDQWGERACSFLAESGVASARSIRPGAGGCSRILVRICRERVSGTGRYLNIHPQGVRWPSRSAAGLFILLPRVGARCPGCRVRRRGRTNVSKLREFGADHVIPSCWRWLLAGKSGCSSSTSHDRGVSIVPHRGRSTRTIRTACLSVASQDRAPSSLPTHDASGPGATTLTASGYSNVSHPHGRARWLHQSLP